MGNEETVNTLLRLKADVNIEDSKKMSPIHIAAQEGKTKMLQILARKNPALRETEQADIYKKDADGRYEYVDNTFVVLISIYILTSLLTKSLYMYIHVVLI